MKKPSGFKQQNSFAHLNFAIKGQLPGFGDEPTDLFTYTFPVQPDGWTIRTNANEPVLLSAYPDPSTVAVVFNSMMNHFRRKGWDQFDTGNWTMMSVYPERSSGVMFPNGQALPVRVRKLSTAQHSRAAEKLTCRAPIELTILQVQLSDPAGYWPGEKDYAPMAVLAEQLMEQVLGELA